MLSGPDELLDRIEADARALVPDTSTAKGRKAIASNAARVAKTKTYLDGLGKEYVAELKAMPKKIDAKRKKMLERLDELRDEVRRPLTELEEAEAKRQAAHREGLAALAVVLPDGTLPTEAKVRDRIAGLERVAIGPEWEELADEAYETKRATLHRLNGMLKEIREAEKKAESERKARETRAERERLERERRQALEREREAQRRAEEAEQCLQREAEEAARRERERIETEKRARLEEEQRRAGEGEHRGHGV